MKNTLNLTSFTQRFKSLSGQSPLWNLTSARRRRVAALLLLALALASLGSWERLTALADVVPGGYVQIQPNAATLNQGTTLQLRSAVLNPLGFELPNRTVTWRSSNAAIATVSDTGLITAVAPGRVTITAKSGAALGTATITVNGPVLPPPNTAPVVRITEPSDGATFQQGAAITFTATATDAEEGNLNAIIVWTAADASYPNAVPTPLGTGASVAPASLAPGAYLITASATDSYGLVGIAQVGITVNAPCSVVIDLQPAQGLRSPQTLQLDATGTYDTCGRPLKYYWTCMSATSTYCQSFMADANGNDNNNPIPTITLQEGDVIGIGLKVCVAGTNECSLPPPPSWWEVGDPSVIRIYEGGVV